jgi:hypothetical protein
MTETSGYLDAWEGTSNKPGALSLAIDMQTALYFGDPECMGILAGQRPGRHQ